VLALVASRPGCAERRFGLARHLAWLLVSRASRDPLLLRSADCCVRAATGGGFPLHTCRTAGCFAQRGAAWFSLYGAVAAVLLLRPQSDVLLVRLRRRRTEADARFAARLAAAHALVSRAGPVEVRLGDTEAMR